MKSRAVLLLALTPLLAGCDETRFALDPLGEPRACDATLAGVWRIVDDGDGAPEYVHLEDDCDVRLLRTPRASEGGLERDAASRPPVRLSPAIGRIDGTLLLTLTDEDFHRAADPEAGDTGHPGSTGGFHVYRLEVRGGTASLRPVDHRAVAKAIIDERLRGSVSKNDDGLKNLLELDLGATRELVRERWLFRRDDPLRLERVAPGDLPAGIRRQVGLSP
jgi:hypothetical protein